MEKKKMTVSDAEVAALAREASAAGDDQMVKVCGRALAGSVTARRECARVIAAARAIAKS